jgi:hypothetical protein
MLNYSNILIFEFSHHMYASQIASAASSGFGIELSLKIIFIAF